MAYEPTNWKAGDVVTSAKLNKLEQGLANLNILVVHLEQIDNPEGTDTDSEKTSIQYFRLDKTLGELLDADFILFSMNAPYGGKLYGMAIGVGRENNDDSVYGIMVTIYGISQLLQGSASEMTEYPIIHT